MLNRLYIVIGVLAILAIAAAFVVPRFIQWGDYRDRMQVIAGEVLGADVEIVGDIEFSLLPQPHLTLNEIRVGGAERPVLTVVKAEAEFSLLDFLRDRYLISSLVLQQPRVDVRVDADGQLDAGIKLASDVTTSNVSVASARIVDGTVALADERSGEVFTVASIDGELRMEAVRGPFSFAGSGDYGGQAFDARIATSALDDEGKSQLTLFLQPTDLAFSLNAEGLLTTATAPSLEGTLTYRQAPPAVVAEGEEQDIGRGDLVVTGKLQASPVRVLLSEYIITPDENRSGTRLTGAAEVTLGAVPSFNAVISGGVLALPPRDATADQANVPYELVRLLAEVPVPPVPSIPGTIGVDIAEVDLRALLLRDVRFDAAAGDGGWTITNFAGRLPGDSRLALSGTLKEEAGAPTFAGDLRIESPRLDSLAALWRKPAEGNPLFNVPGSLAAKLSLVGETLSVSDATLTIEETPFAFDVEVGFAAATRHLNIHANLGALSEQDSRALVSLLPDLGSDPTFGVSFPKGLFELSAEAMTIDGLPGRGLLGKGTWDGGVLALDELRAEDFGGVAVDAALTAFGTIQKPELSGTLGVAIARANAPALARLFDVAGTPVPVRRWLEQWLPADLSVRLDAPSGDGGQGLGVTGKVGVADLTFDAKLGVGVLRALEGPMSVRLELRSDEPTALTAQIGLGDVSLLPEGAPMTVVAVVDGTAANSFETTVRMEGGGESLAFAGNVVASRLEALSGNGNLRVAMSDFSALTESIGIGGIWVPAVEGTARVEFTALDRIRLTGIEAAAGGQPFTGSLEWVRTTETSAISGEIEAGTFDTQSLLALLAGPAATISNGADFWPDGPTALGDVPRRTTGLVKVTAPSIIAAGVPVLTDASFDLGWDATSVRVRDFKGTIGGGSATAELTVCCAGPAMLKQVTARVALSDVVFASLVPKPIADAISATVTAGARFEGSGDTLLGAMKAMTAEGSYTLKDVSIAGFDPSAFGAIPTLDAILEMEPSAVTALIIDRLDDNAFAAPEVSGSFTVAGGVLRSPNVAIEGADARLFGSTIVDLADLALGGGFVMSPTKPTGPDGMLTEANAQVAANFGGTLPAPTRTFDITGMVDTIMVRAFEIELARLEEIRAADEARQRAAAAERERVVAEEAARLAAEEEAKRLAEEEAARLEAEQAAADDAAAAEAAAQQGGVQLQPGFNLEPQPQPF